MHIAFVHHRRNEKELHRVGGGWKIKTKMLNIVPASLLSHMETQFKVLPGVNTPLNQWAYTLRMCRQKAY